MSLIELHYDVPGDDFTRAGEASGNVKVQLKKLGFDPSVIRNVVIALYEGEINMVIHAGGGQIDVSIDPDQIRMVLTDHGPGIPEENQPEIFCPGFSTKINYETGEVSRGLGLNLVHDLIKDQFHGTISLESVPGKTTFTITVPKTTFTQKG